MKLVAAIAIVLTASPVFAQTPAADPHAGHSMGAQQPAPAARPDNAAIPPDNAASADRLKASPRHGEWVDIKMAAVSIEAHALLPIAGTTAQGETETLVIQNFEGGCRRRRSNERETGEHRTPCAQLAVRHWPLAFSLRCLLLVHRRRLDSPTAQDGAP